MFYVLFCVVFLTFLQKYPGYNAIWDVTLLKSVASQIDYSAAFVRSFISSFK